MKPSPSVRGVALFGTLSLIIRLLPAECVPMDGLGGCAPAQMCSRMLLEGMERSVP